ncbi:neutral zinc metallopeptidase family [Syntrophus aciditrophicus SB]|uniref:Neutral zinc metallopeptidase family n=2 Tax=Syntrophus TaxID=43773 RepID=Q2LV72_SYNAS|nr:neutral zinc metallopeptidase family [Syntrophus aciditrophicus SB]
MNGMRWQNQRRSENVEDRRGVTVKRGIAGAGIGTVILVLLSLYFGIDPSVVLQQVQETGPPPVSQQEQTVRQDPTSQFVSVVLADTETTWHEIFRRSGRTYEEPKLVLFSGAVQSACGFAQAAMGPFYCPGDRKVYIDLSFFEDMKNRFQAPGDFAQAYVIAHEVGHHVQNLLGITDQTQRAMQQMSKVEANQLSVRVELQADCFAGVWGCHADKVRNILESGDLEEALGAASAIGDDRIMKQTRGTIVPDAFTHGTSEQRVRWFKRGFESGDPGQCDAFNAKYL